MSQAPPHYSPDGRFWWNGGEWVPVGGDARLLAPRPSSKAQLIRVTVEGLIALLLVGTLVSVSLDQGRQANRLLAGQLAAQKSQLAQQQSQIETLLAQVSDLKERWIGTPAIWQPPPIANVAIEFFDVTGGTQAQLIASLNSSSICSTRKCSPDPAVPNAVAWALEGSRPGSSYTCYSPGTTTLIYQAMILLPRWSPPADGAVKIGLVQAWNALEQVLYTHEAGHAAIDIQDTAALNDQAHHLGSCQELIDFWSNPSVFDKLNADQDAYHARLHADCRPEIGCFPVGWMGW
jgi:Bacterial protein of unknown function (DUF922)